MFSLGGIVEKVCDAVGAPEWLGDVASIGVGFVSGDPISVMDGMMDLTPNVCDFVEDKFDLNEPSDKPWWKNVLKDVVAFERGSAEFYEKTKGFMVPALTGPAPGGTMPALPTPTV